MSYNEVIRYWIPSFEINKKVITQELQYYLGSEATIRPNTREGQDGYLISTPGACLTDEQIDDICQKSREVWEKQAAARTKNGSNQELKRPLHQPIVISSGSSPRGETSRSHRRLSRDRDGRSSRHHSDDYRNGGGSSSRW